DNGSSYRGWDLWMQQDRVGMHLINTWPDDALKVVSKNPLPLNQWTHVLVTYDGSAKATGARVYYNRVPQPVDVEAAKLGSTPRPTVARKIGQRPSGERVQQVVVRDLRVYGRALTTGEAERLAKSPRAGEILGKPADKRTPQEANELYEWW